MIANHLVNNLVDYALGIEFVKNVSYFKEMYLKDIEEKWNIDLSALSNQGKAAKRFDFVIKTDKMIYGIETNFYGGGGSKLNETARSYKMLSQEADTIEGFPSNFRIMPWRKRWYLLMWKPKYANSCSCLEIRALLIF